MPRGRATRRSPARRSRTTRSPRKPSGRTRSPRRSPSRGRTTRRTSSRSSSRSKSSRSSSRGSSYSSSSYSAPSHSAPSYSSYSAPSSYAVAAEPVSYIPPAPTHIPTHIPTFQEIVDKYPAPVYKKPDYTTVYPKPLVTPYKPKETTGTYEGVTKGKFRYRSKSPSRKKGEYGRNDPKKNLTWLEYMIESGYYGNDKICLATASITYDVINRDLTKYGQNEAVFWSLVDCPYPVVIIQITAVFKKGEATHANVLIVNKTGPEWQIERFEPHGQVLQGQYYGEGNLLADMQDRIDEDLKTWFNKILYPIKQRFSYRRPIDICPRTGPQTRSEEFESLGGFCQTWTLFYVDMKLTHPELTSDELLEILFSLDPKELYEMIQDYVHFVKETKVSKEFEEYMFEKLFMTLKYERNVEEVRKSPKYTDGEKDEISHELFKVIAKAPVDKETVDVLNELDFFITKIITDPELPGKTFTIIAPVIKALQGKRLSRRMDLKDLLWKIYINIKLSSLEAAGNYVSAITNILR